MPRIEHGINPSTGLGGLDGLLHARQEEFTAAIQKRLDDFARTRGYDSTDSMAKYLGCTVPKFAAEAGYMRDAVALTWDKGYEIMRAVLSGQRSMPSMEEVFAELPTLAWPEEEP